MKIDVKNIVENATLSRNELKGIIEFESQTPSNSEFKESLSKELDSSKDLLVIKKINQHYGQNIADFEAYQYFSEESLKAIENIKQPSKDKEEDKKEE